MELASAVNPNLAIIDYLQAELQSSLSKVARPIDKYAILDFPNHFNVGDSAIFVGEMYLARKFFHRNPELVTEAHPSDLATLRRQTWSGPLLLHGGGNFGDWWPAHQDFREAVLRTFPDREVIQLPQSINFRDQANIARAARTIADHSRFTLMVRDEESRDFANRHFDCTVILAPDMAFMIGAREASRSPDADVIYLLRGDHEGVLNGADTQKLGPDAQIVDWPRENRPDRSALAKTIARIRWKLGVPAKPHRLSPAEYLSLAETRVQRGFDLLSRGKVIVTDRLHAHILSLLLGRPHVALDNSYGKIRNFSKQWTLGGDFAQVSTLGEANIRAREFLS